MESITTLTTPSIGLSCLAFCRNPIFLKDQNMKQVAQKGKGRSPETNVPEDLHDILRS